VHQLPCWHLLGRCQRHERHGLRLVRRGELLYLGRDLVFSVHGRYLLCRRVSLLLGLRRGDVELGRFGVVHELHPWFLLTDLERHRYFILSDVRGRHDILIRCHEL
jgi:hypothetical protein